MDERVAWGLLVVLLSIAGFSMYQYFSSAEACRERGGVPLRGPYWIECVHLEKK
jgi:hypothetical protein